MSTPGFEGMPLGLNDGALDRQGVGCGVGLTKVMKPPAFMLVPSDGMSGRTRSQLDVEGLMFGLMVGRDDLPTGGDDGILARSGVGADDGLARLTKPPALALSVPRSSTSVSTSLFSARNWSRSVLSS